MSRKKPEKKSVFGLPVNVDVDIANIRTHEKKILEFVSNKVKPREAIVVKADKWGGLLKQSFVVLNKDGKDFIIKQIKEERIPQKKDRKKSKYPKSVKYV